MSRTETRDVMAAVGAEFAEIEGQRRERIAAANTTYWCAVQMAADGTQVNPEESAAISDAMQALDRTMEEFSGHVAKLRDVRELREEGDREKAEERRDELRGKIQEGNRRLLASKKQVGDLQEGIGNLAGAYHAVMDRANALRQQGEQIALGLRQAGAGVLDELAEPRGAAKPIARLRALQQIFINSVMRLPGDCFEAPVDQATLDAGHVELLAWLDEQEPEG